MGNVQFDEIVAHLDGKVSAIETQYALELLRRQGYIADSAAATLYSRTGQPFGMC